MAIIEQAKESWGKEKEKLKQQFQAITGKFILFDEADQSSLSEKLQKGLAKTKAELHVAIEAM